MLSKVSLQLRSVLLVILFISFTNTFVINSEQHTSVPTADQILLNSRLNDKDSLQKGSSIDDNVLAFLKKNLEQSFIFNRNDYNTTQSFMFKKLNQTYPGSWTIVFIQPVSEGEYPLPIRDFDLISYSLNGSWWVYIRGNFNKYLPDMSYIFIRTSSTYLSNADPQHIFSDRLYNKTTPVMSNIIYAVQLQASKLTDQLNQISENYQMYSPGKKYNYFLNIPYNLYYSRFVFYVYGKNQYENDIVPTQRNKFWFTTF